MGVARVKGQQEKHRPFQEAFNVMKLMKLTHLCLRILSDGQRMTKPLLVKLIKKKFFLNYNKVVFFKKGKKNKIK